MKNDGYGVPPKPDCEKCNGQGFYYENDKAKTCECKLKAICSHDHNKEMCKVCAPAVYQNLGLLNY